MRFRAFQHGHRCSFAPRVVPSATVTTNTALAADPGTTHPLPCDAWSASALRFILGGLATAVFSSSLVRLSAQAPLSEVFATGMVVPSFTWAVQLAAAALLLPRAGRDAYWGDLSRACLLGSVLLVPAGIFNWFAADPPRWPSILSIGVSVIVMAVLLFRRAAIRRASLAWPASWCVTILVNITLFALASRSWWR